MRRAFGFDDPRNADRRRTVARGVREHHGRFEAGDQTLVAVRARVRERVDGLGVLDDAADVVQRRVGEAAVLVTREQRHAGFLQRLVHVHARAVVADERLRHEGRRLAVAVRHVVDGVLEDLHFVGLLHEAAGTHADFALAAGGHFVVMHFDLEAHLFERVAHRASGCPGMRRPAEPGSSRP